MASDRVIPLIQAPGNGRPGPTRCRLTPFHLGEDSEGEDYGSRNYRPFNRGNKHILFDDTHFSTRSGRPAHASRRFILYSSALKRLLEQPALVPTKPTLWPLHSIEEELEVHAACALGKLTRWRLVRANRQQARNCSQGRSTTRPALPQRRRSLSQHQD